MIVKVASDGYRTFHKLPHIQQAYRTFHKATPHSRSYYTLDKLPHIRQASTHSTSHRTHILKCIPPSSVYTQVRSCRHRCLESTHIHRNPPTSIHIHPNPPTSIHIHPNPPTSIHIHPPLSTSIHPSIHPSTSTDERQRKSTNIPNPCKSKVGNI